MSRAERLAEEAWRPLGQEPVLRAVLPPPLPPSEWTEMPISMPPVSTAAALFYQEKAARGRARRRRG